MGVLGCSPEALIGAVTALIVAVTALIRQFQHEKNVNQQVNGTSGESTPAGTGKPTP